MPWMRLASSITGYIPPRRQHGQRPVHRPRTRVSYDAAWRAGEDEGSDARLIRYLWKNAHTTPFEAVTLTFEVHAPIFVFRQWHRHRTWSFNELSARYRELPEEFYVPDAAMIGEQSKSSNRREFSTLPTPLP